MKKITFMLMMLLMTSVAFSQVTIGTGDDGGSFESPPYNPYYGYSYGQSIYLASEINASGNITAVEFELNGAGTTIDSADEMVDVWIGHTTKASFDSTTDWVDVSTLTQVLTNGTVTLSGSTITVTFDAPFAYNGTDNIIIAVDANEDGFNTSADHILATDGPTADMSIMYRSDSVNPDPTAPPTAQNLRQSRGNITFIGITQACPSPSNLTATNITDTSADLGWTDNAGAASWNIELGLDGFTPTETPTNSGVSNPFNAMSLTPATDYDFYVQADCGGDTSSWVGPFSFTTNCPANFTPEYNADMSVNAPLCWEEADSGDATTGPGDLGSGLWFSSNHNGTPSNVINMFFNTRSDWIISPEFDLSSAAPSELRIYVALTESTTSGSGADLGSDDEVQLLMTTDGGANWTSMQSWTQGNVPTDIGEQISYDLSAITGTVQFAFLGDEGDVNDPEDVYFHVSQFQIREIPSCLEPTDLTATNITATSADLGWTDNAGAASWNVELGVDGFTPTQTPTNSGVTNPFNAMSLTPNTAYDFYVQADCGGDTSPWAGPFSFTTPCTAFTPEYDADMSTNVPDCWEEANSGDATTGPGDIGAGLWFASNHNGTPSNVINMFSNTRSDWIISPVIDLSSAAPSELRIYVALTESLTSGSGADLGSDDEVQLLMTTDGGANWTSMQSWTQGNVPTDVGEQITYDLSAITGTVQFAFLGDEGDVDDTEDVYFHVSQFQVRETPACPEPSGLTVTPSSPTEANVSWTSNGSETQWTYEYGVSPYTFGGGGTSASVMTTPSASLSGLTPGETYDIYVVANCGGGDSVPLGPTTWTQPLEGEDCTTSFSATVEADCSAATPISLDFTAGGSETLPSCDLSGNTGYWVDFRAPGSGTININLSGSATSVGAAIFDACGGSEVFCNNNTLGAETEVSGLTPGANYYIYFWQDTGNGVADVCIEEVSCGAPSNIAAVATDTTADLSWDAVPGAASYNWEIQPDGTAQGTATPFSGNVAGTTDTATGLASDTAYDLFVQADCGGGGTSEWVGPISFNTLIPPPACGGNFFDTGGSSGSYSSNENYTVTICPDTPGEAVTVTFTSFLVEGDGADDCYDQLFIFDGSDDSGTPITPGSLGIGSDANTTGFCWQEVGDGTADLTGQAITSTDASGCLTFTFTSDGSVTFSGWEANVTCAVLGVDDVEGQGSAFTYYPNPVKNTLTLNAQQNIQNITMYNMLGQQVLTTSPNTLNTEVDMSQLETGTYFVKVSINDATKTVRVIKQ